MSNLPSIATVSLSSSLRAACEPKREYAYDPDDERKGHLRESWSMPERITEQLKRDAAAAVRQMDAALVPANPQMVRQWLTALGVLVAGSMTAGDAKAKVGAYAPMLDHPACCYTRETLEEAGREFKFFPSFSEVAAFLDRKAEPVRLLRQRLNAISRAPVTEREAPVKRYRDLSPEERARVDQMFASARTTAIAQPEAPQPKSTLRPVHVNSPVVDAYVAQATAEKDRKAHHGEAESQQEAV
jgi:hypothetical protein